MVERVSFDLMCLPECPTGHKLTVSRIPLREVPPKSFIES